MSDSVEWRSIYGRPTLFVGGTRTPARGPMATSGASGSGREDRVQGGRERYILSAAGEETAREVLLAMYERARGEAA